MLAFMEDPYATAVKTIEELRAQVQLWTTRAELLATATLHLCDVQDRVRNLHPDAFMSKDEALVDTARALIREYAAK